MLLRHAWLAGLSQPETISEDAQDSPEQPVPPPSIASGKGDQEVADWVVDAIAKRKARIDACRGSHQYERPPLHAAPLDAVMTPLAAGKLKGGSVETVAKGIRNLAVEE